MMRLKIWYSFFRIQKVNNAKAKIFTCENV